MVRRGKPQAALPSADITTSTPSTNPNGKRGPGRPPVHEEEWTKVTVVLFNRQIDFLDRLASNIRAQNGASISRAQLIRALIDALAEGDIDLTAARSEKELKEALMSRIGRDALGA